MIDRVGLIYPGNQEQIPFAWELYSNKDDNVAKFKEAFSRENVDLHFLGAWDTVSSVGIFSGDILPMTDKCGHITHFRHALALDECRVKFLPEHVQSPKTGGGSIKEVWFAGTHSDIGGGNIANKDLNRGGEPLKWMMEEAQHEGLSVKLHDVKIGIPTAEVIESLGGIWWLLEVIPMPRRVRSAVSTSKVKWTPHWGKARSVLPGQKIHWSVRASSTERSHSAAEDRSQSAYQPKAILLKQKPGAALDEHITVEWKDILETTNSGDNFVDPLAALDHWEGEKHLMAAVDLVKEYLQGKGDNDQWFERLFDYVKTSGKPEMIWTYGGPRLLHNITKTYPQEDNTWIIIRKVVGFTYDNPQTKQAMQPEAGKPSAEQAVAKAGSDGPSLEDISKSSVIPRIHTLLEQWNGPEQAEKTELKPEPWDLWRWLQTFFKASETTAEPDATHSSFLKSRDSPATFPTAAWSIQSIPVESRSVRFVRVLMDVMIDLVKLDCVKGADDIIYDLSRTVLGLLPQEVIIPAADEEGLAEVIVNTIAKFCIHDAAKAIFHEERVISRLAPWIDIQEKYPTTPSSEGPKTYHELVSKVISVIGAMGDHSGCADEAADSVLIILTLVDLMAGSDKIQEPKMQQQLAKEAINAVQILARDRWCCIRLTSAGACPRFLQMLNRRYMVKETLRAMALFPRHMGSFEFSAQDVGVLVSNMTGYPDASVVLANIEIDGAVREAMRETGAITQAVNLLSNKDIQKVKAAADFVKSLLNDDELRADVIKPPFASVLATQLEGSSREITEESLEIIFRLVPLDSRWITDGLAEALTKSVENQNKKATIAVAWIMLYTDKYQDKAMQTIHQLVNMLAEKEEEIVEGATTVLTRMVKQDQYRDVIREGFIFYALHYVMGLATRSSFYSPPEGTWHGRLSITTKAFEMVEALATDSTDRQELIDIGILNMLFTLTDGPESGILDRRAQATLERLKAYDDLRPAIQRLENGGSSDAGPDPEGGDKSEGGGDNCE
ncbi:hypothetical protein FRC12_011627 [Ceratobasidium sp. 428]|nr:hypothetical protein FRC12_011627 [Ceratobasidium sp. 428]